MDDHCDDSMGWDGLACPPLEDYAFTFDTNFTPDDMLDDLLLEFEEEDDEDIVTKYSKEDEELNKMVAACMENPPTPLSHDLLDLFPTNFNSGQDFGRKDGKADIRTVSYGKGKQLMILRSVLCKSSHDCPSKQQLKDGSRRDHTDQVVAAGHKRKVDNQLILEGKVTRHCGNHGKGKELSTAIQVLDLDKAQVQAFLRETEEFVEKKDKKRKITDRFDCLPMQRKDMTKLECTNRLDVGNKGKSDHTDQLDVVDKTMNDDYDLKFEASRHKLHERYQLSAEAKQQRQIQIIDFQIPVTQQPRCNAKSKGKPSFRQKLMALETCKSNKKFAPFKAFSSCVQ